MVVPMARFHTAQPLRLLAVLCLGALPLSGVLAQQAAVPTASRPGVVLQPGDKVQLKIWREPDLSGEFLVAADGAVIFPMIGRVLVTRLSTDSLRAFLVDLYSTALRTPAIEVTALQRVNVVGAVRNPGFYYADPTVTVTGALALAGGITSEGNRNRIELVREGKRIPIALSHGTALTDAALQSGDQISVTERSWLARNTGLVASVISATAFFLAAVIR